MDDSKIHAIEYWKEVYNIGSVVFKDVRNQAGSLKCLLNIVMSGPLLSEIECLSANLNNTMLPCPFSNWLLQGIFISTTAYGRDRSLEQLCIESQSKILTASFHRSILDYQHLVTKYFSAIETTMTVALDEEYFAFLNDVCVLEKVKLNTNASLVTTEKQRIRFIKLLFLAVEKTYRDCLKGCKSLLLQLWSVFASIAELNSPELLCTVLPLMKDLIHSKELSDNFQDYSQILLAMPHVLTLDWLNDNKNMRLFLVVWQFLKENASLCSAEVEDLLSHLKNVKDHCLIPSFVSTEMGWLLHCLPRITDIPHYISNFNSWPLQEKFLLYEDFILEDILLSSNKLENAENSKGGLHVVDLSHNWRKLLPEFTEFVNKSNTSDAKISCLLSVLKTISRLTGRIEKTLAPKILIFKFLDDSFIMVLVAVVQHLGLFKEACSAFSYLMNLRESSTIPEICCRDQLASVVKTLNVCSGPLDGDDLSNLLRGLRNIPPGVQPDTCVSIFVQFASQPIGGVLPQTATVESVPFLYLSGRASATHLIAEVLMPVILSDREDAMVAAIDATCNLVCAVAGTAYIALNEMGESSVKCWECEAEGRILGTRGSVDTIENHVKQLMVPLFASTPRVRHQLLSVVPRLSTHMTGLQGAEIMKRFLQLLNDPCGEVRRELANCITCLIFTRPLVLEGQLSEISPFIDVDPNDPSWNALSLAFDALSKEIVAKLGNEQWSDKSDTLLLTLSKIASFPSPVVLKQSLQLLLLFINMCPYPLMSFGSSIAACHKATSLVLYHRYKPEVSEVIGKIIERNYLSAGCPTRISLSGIFFKGLSKVNLNAGSGQYIVPRLVIASAKQKQMRKLLVDYADYFEAPLTTIITNAFPHIYVQIWLGKSTEVFKACMDLIEQLLAVKIPDLVFHSQKVIIHQLLFNFHTDEGHVVKGLKQVIGGLSQASNREQIASSLESRFVGYLLFLVGKFSKEENSETEQVQALESLTAVLSLMGEVYVTPVARKVLATLTTMHSLDHYAHASLLCKAWYSFVRVVKTRHLGPLLATIVVTVLSLLETDEEGVLKILKYLLVEEKDNFTEHISKLVFLKDWSPVLEPVIGSIKSYITFEREDIKDRLVRETALATHETVGVRIEGLKALLSTIKSASADVQSLIIGSDEADNCVRALREALLMGCRDTDTKISSLAAVCLGELGAVDPSLLPRQLKSRNVLPLSAHDSEFGFLALSEILRGFQNARSSVDMDAFAVGIQELLKIYSVTESPENPTWMKFSAAEHSLLRPMLSSRYTVQAPIRNKWPHVIFGNREAGSHMSWAALWANKLIAACADAKAVILFRACEPSMKRDSKILLFFLKYILLHVITQDAAVHENILREMDVVTALSPEGRSEEKRKFLLPIRMIEYSKYPLIRTSIGDSDARACAMTVFLLTDFLQYWTRSYLSQNVTQSGDHLKRRDYCLVKEFLEKISLKKVVTANFELQEYLRTIQYVEEIMRKDPSSWPEHLPILSKSYALHGDLDSVGGARALHQSASNIEEQLFYRQMSRQLEEARILYEQLGRSSKMSASQTVGMVQCYLQLGEPTVAYNCIQNQIQQMPELAPVMSESMAECLLKLGDWNTLSTALDTEVLSGQRNWFTQLSRITHNLKEELFNDVDKCLKTTRCDLVENLTSLRTESENEQNCYHYLVRLQILNEVDRIRGVVTLSDRNEVNSSLEAMFREWDKKLDLVQSSGDYLEQVLCSRRTLLCVLSNKLPKTCSKLINEQLGRYWVKSAETARKAGCFHQAFNYIVSAEQFNIPLTFIEKSKLLWDKGNKDESLATLTNGMSTHFPDVEKMKSLPSGERLEERKMAAEALLLYAIYNEETSNCSSSTNKTNYQQAYEMCREMEKTQVMLAQCMDRCLSLLGDGEEDEKRGCELRVAMVNYFGKSLQNGCEYIYQTVPRMLSVWFDLGENMASTERYTAMTKINKLIKFFAERLPPFVFMTALPQLLSRIAHPTREVYCILKSIIVTLIRAYPQQCLWALQTLAKSSVPERSARYKEMMQDKLLQADDLSKLIRDFTALCDKLNRLTNINLPQKQDPKLLVSSVMRDLPQLFRSDKFSPIIVPITRFCAISLPKDIASSTHQAFPKNPVTIVGIQDEMAVLPSLQRPRKISFLGSDGKYYDILCKPKDDLRRDARLMEFNNVVNMYLHRDPESRARQLHIRTYVVTPLGESGGLLEWIPQLVGLRPALFHLYKQHGLFVPPRDVRKYDTAVRDSLEKKREMLVDKLLPLHPPIFHEWFRLTFPDPAGWYAARLAYIRTTALMSMVGYILGLGDRHGENILFDRESGDTVHVDFNCLFNKGEQFLFKEKVPFRLTHNMVSAMGPCGVEGTFRKSCEISMRLLRAQGKTLMSVLTPSAYDPFGSWGKNKQIQQQERDQKIAEALEELRDIERRLNGSLRVKQKNDTFYLSVEGLVRSLIAEATSIDNLSQMYLGWGAYL